MKISKLLAFLLLLSVVFTFVGCVPRLDTNPIYETVGNDFFSVYSYSEEKTSEGISLRVAILTDISLFYYNAAITLIDENGGELLTHTEGKDEIIESGATFSVYVPLGEVDYSSISELKLECSGKTNDISGEYTSDKRPRVTFMCDGIRWARQTAKASEPIPCPDTPQLIGKGFEGWYKDKELSMPYDFASGATEDIIVYAKLLDDISSTVNRITKEIMTAAVTVKATYTEDKLWNPSVMKSTSSGIIIRKGETSYILTNNHSVTLLDGYKKIEFEVEDCFGNTYPASIVSVGGNMAADATYDLAILEVKGLSEKLSAIEMSASNPQLGERVFSIGSPAGQQNAITIGAISSYCNVKLDTEAYLSNVEFGVIYHTAEVRQGSSGGALLNEELELVGINFAGKKGDTFSEAYAIPVEKVLEFIDKYM